MILCLLARGLLGPENYCKLWGSIYLFIFKQILS